MKSEESKCVLVCGSRSWGNRNSIEHALAHSWVMGYRRLIHGGAKGADKIAAEIAENWGFIVTEFKAEWDKHGKAAGPIRNTKMLEEGKPDLVLAFQIGESSGTQHMVDISIEAGVQVRLLRIYEGKKHEDRGS